MGPIEGLSLPVTCKCLASPRFVWTIICLTKVCDAFIYRNSDMYQNTVVPVGCVAL